MFCLDTNIVIGIINGRLTALEARFRETVGQAPLMLSALVLFELRYGYAKSDRRSRMEALLATFLEPGIEVLPFDAAEAGDIRAALEAQGAPIGPYDLLIAEQARRRGAGDAQPPRVRARAGSDRDRLGDVNASPYTPLPSPSTLLARRRQQPD